MSSLPSLPRLAPLAILTSAAIALTGCTALSVTATSPLQNSGVSLQGKIHGGSQPVVGAKIYLLAANSADYPTATTNASVPLLTSATGSTPDDVGYYVTTDGGGNFSITGDYTCTAGQQVYLLALGGNPGLSAANTHIGLATVLGNCPSSGNFLATTPNLIVDEVTTVAAAYSLAGFAVDSLHVGAPSSTTLSPVRPTALTGITNAFATFPLLANVATGAANTTTGAGNGLVPQSEINTLANILSACINSTGDLTQTNSNCSQLFANATSDGTTSGTAPTDTFTAAINIAHNPAANIANLCTLQPGLGAPYQPSLPCSSEVLPNDFTVSIRYPEIGGDILTDLAIDGTGNVLATSTGGYVARYVASSGYTETIIDKTGIAYNSLAIGTNTVFIGPPDTHFIVMFDLQGGSFSDFILNGFQIAPRGLALSSDEHMLYICDNSNPGGVQSYDVSNPSNVTFLAAATAPFDQPLKVAVDPSGNVWAINENASTSSVGGMTALGVNTPNEPTTGGYAVPFTNGGSGVAIDQTGLVWFTSTTGGAAGQLSPTGANFSESGAYYRYTGGNGGGQFRPNDVAVDSANHAWFANELNTTGVQAVALFDANGLPLSPGTGYQPSNPDASDLNAVAVDSSGNLWTISNAHLFQFIGAASPVVTPLVANLQVPYTTAASKP